MSFAKRGQTFLTIALMIVVIACAEDPRAGMGGYEPTRPDLYVVELETDLGPTLQRFDSIAVVFLWEFSGDTVVITTDDSLLFKGEISNGPLTEVAKRIVLPISSAIDQLGIAVNGGPVGRVNCPACAPFLYVSYFANERQLNARLTDQPLRLR